MLCSLVRILALQHLAGLGPAHAVFQGTLHGQLDGLAHCCDKQNNFIVHTRGYHPAVQGNQVLPGSYVAFQLPATPRQCACMAGAHLMQERLEQCVWQIPLRGRGTGGSDHQVRQGWSTPSCSFHASWQGLDVGDAGRLPPCLYEHQHVGVLVLSRRDCLWLQVWTWRRRRSLNTMILSFSSQVILWSPDHSFGTTCSKQGCWQSPWHKSSYSSRPFKQLASRISDPFSAPCNVCSLTSSLQLSILPDHQPKLQTHLFEPWLPLR